MKQLFVFIFFIACITNAISQVGIGTNSPNINSILELKSSNKGFLFPRTSTTTRLTISPVKGMMVYDTTLNRFFFGASGGWVELANGPINTHWTKIQDYNDIVNNNNPANVVIGSWNGPTPYKLSVHGISYVQGDPKTTLKLGGLSSTTEARILWELPSNGMHYNITANLNKLYISRTTGASGFTDDIVIDPNGLVGIGTPTPQVKLNVDSGSDVGNGNGGYLQLGVQSGLNVGFDNNEIQGRNAGAVSRLVLNNGGGTVQIGSAVAPTTYSLAVNGRVICEELKIQASSNWADYVFANDYSLKSLDELRNFITTHNHLPNIPDAATIEKNGIDIGDMQKRMMEKIEELTLYVLQLEEKNKLQDKEIAALKSGRP